MDERFVSEPRSAEYISNMYVGSDGAWRSSGGLTATMTWPGHGNPVYSLHQFRQGGLQWTVLEHEDTSLTARPYKTLTLAYVDYRNDTLVDIDVWRVRI